MKSRILLSTLLIGFTICQVHPIEKGQKAILFGYTGDFKLSSFSGSTIAFKYHASESYSLRLSLSAYEHWRNQQDYRKYETTPDYDYYHREQDIRADFTLKLQYIKCRDSVKPIALYYGLGPSLGYQYSHRDNTSDEPYNRYESYVFEYSLGIHGIVGIEWIVTDSISILGEYESGYSYVWSTTKMLYFTDNYKKRYEHENWFFSRPGVKMAVCVYFD